MRLGRDEHVLDDRRRFYASKVCYEYTIEYDSAAAGGLIERHRLYVAYVCPGTGEAVERIYRAAAIETDTDAIEVATSAADGEIGPDGWGTIEYEAICPTGGVAVLPKCVHQGEPLNFRASVAPHPDEPRIGENRDR
ncbi:hypothetical protein [Halosolutus gelatinilyticus]|uniref:hypothetical protein n=1 Tax=Halosolutus gelatinilyticus TaxID=2931975 RepID=UPI001FF3B665|nr:hypothetical protein [Halosolutus gelatinilyticus]